MIRQSYLFKEWSRTWRRFLGVQISTLVVLTATFTVIFSAFSILGNLRSILTKWGKDVQVTVFLDEELNKEQISTIEQGIKSVADFKTVQYLNKDEAKKRFLKQMPAFSVDIADDPEFANPFPASFQLGGLSPALLGQLPSFAEKISKLGGVEDVSYGQEWIENYAGFIRGVTQSGVFVLITLILGSLLVVGNSVRVGLAHRRDEIAILELVGATNRMIRAPFIFEGAMMGAIASTLALIVSYGIFILETHLVQREMGFLGISEVFAFFHPTVVLGLLAFGAASGALGAYLCVRSVNTGWAATEERG